ncbi:unnamed protein product, partial [Meganyctiphanes norvegica]
MSYWICVKHAPRSVHIIWMGLVIVVIHLYSVAIQHEEQFTNHEESKHLPGYSVYAIKLLKKSYLHPPSRKYYNITFGNSQYTQGDAVKAGPLSILINSIFGDKMNGFFIEAGALDGVHLSNSLKLELEKNWTGLLIEPNPVSYKQLLQKNRKTWTSNTCISSENFTKETVLVALSDDRDVSPMNVRGASYELENNVQNIYIMNKTNFKISNKHYVVVQCFPLVTYILALDVNTVDLLSLDIQGTEKQVLATLPYEIINFRLILVENISDEKDTQLISNMKLRGYRYLFNDCENYMFLKEGNS